MRSDLQRVSTVDMSEEQWLAFRMNGVGGSETGIVLGLSPYKSSLELFYDKLSLKPALQENEAMHWGNALEDLIADRWQYWDRDALTMIQNYAAGKIVRKCRRVNAYLINPEYPYLFSSLDRVINKTENTEEGVLEIKTISGFTTRQWENGIPPSYVIQLQTYLLVTGLLHGEIALLKDGRYMEVIPFQKSEIIHNRIIEKCSAFWNRVTEARAILQNENVTTHEHLVTESARKRLHELEPEPDGSESYEQFINTRYKVQPFVVKGEKEHFDYALRYTILGRNINELADQQREMSNKLKAFMAEAEEIDLGAKGKITWKENNKGSRVFNVRIKQLEEV